MASPSSMPWRSCGRCIRNGYLRAGPARTTPPQPRFLSTTSPLRSSSGTNPLRSTGEACARQQEYANTRRSMIISSAGIAACAIAMYGVIKLDLFGLDKLNDSNNTSTTTSTSTTKLDGPPGFNNNDNPSVLRLEGQQDSTSDKVDTGTSSIPHFPATIRLPKSLGTQPLKPSDEIAPPSHEDENEEYQLLGLGIRTVSFLRIQVYVVGMYVAKSDLAELQQRLVRTAVNPPTDDKVVPNASFATSLVSTERQALRQLLLDPERGDAAWDAILKTDGLRSVFRVVPTRNTDFMHLRDGWVRGITARAQKYNAAAKAKKNSEGEFGDESFGTALNDFKGVFGGGQRKSVPKGQILYLVRGANGALDALYQPEETKPMRFMGRVADERISRLVWMNYLAGKNVSSEGARASVVDGVMEIVERPVGTVVTRVI